MAYVKVEISTEMIRLVNSGPLHFHIEASSLICKH